MPTSIREQLLVKITAAVGGEFFVPTPIDERNLPVTVVVDQPDAADDQVYGFHALAMPVVIARIAETTSTDGAELRAQANALLAALIQEMYVNETFDGLADGLDYAGGGIQTEVGKFLFAEATFSVRYHHQHGDPYTQN